MGVPSNEAGQTAPPSLQDRRVSRRQRLGRLLVGAAVLLLAGVAVTRLIPPAGPLMNVPDAAGTRSTITGYAGHVGQAVTFGSWPLENHTTSLMIVTAISPTNVPAGLVVQVGPADRVTGSALGRLPTRRLPFAIAPGTLRASGLVTLTATRPGRYIVQGLLVTYNWRGQHYEAYLPDEFAMCASPSRPTAVRDCSRLPSPPATWPWGARVAVWLEHW